MTGMNYDVYYLPPPLVPDRRAEPECSRRPRPADTISKPKAFSVGKTVKTGILRVQKVLN